ncbi:MAG TPA: thioesterase family protein [Microthrixaceae bacterium]|nr:thioesterase family protein [Microthrixaceae bacterium]
MQHDQTAGPIADIANDTTPTAVDGVPGRFTTVIPDGWRVMYAFGGVTMATALRAIEAAVDRPDLRLVTADATFCAAVPCGPVAIEVEVLRDGRNGAQAQARLWSTDDPAGARGSDLLVTAVLGADRPGLSSMTSEFPTDAGHPDTSLIRQPPADGAGFPQVPYHDQTDFRLAVGGAAWSRDVEPRGDARSVSWFRFLRPPVRDDGTWEPATMAVPADILGPAVVEATGRPNGFFFVVTLQMSVQWFAPMRTEWLCQHTRAHHVGNGFSTGVAELWSDERELVGLATQCAMLRDMKPG